MPLPDGFHKGSPPTSPSGSLQLASLCCCVLLFRTDEFCYSGIVAHKIPAQSSMKCRAISI
uniref:Uncharacterized protein n=1 Tax=Arundo donax TaxID=35708 RepID=A0A0A9ANK6_ARUDO